MSEEEKIGRMLATIERIVKDFYGNGGDGILKVIPKLEVKIDLLADDIKEQCEVSASQARSISALATVYSEMKAVDNYKSKNESLSWKKAGIIISSILGIASIITTLMIKLL